MDWTGMISNYLFRFKGRVDREQMWIYLALVIVAAIVLMIASAVLGQGILFSILALPAIAALAWAALAVGAKRRHDRNVSGQTALMVFVLLVATFVLKGFVPGGVAGLILSRALLGTQLIIAFYLFIVLFCLHGTRGDNDYGPDPIVPELDPNDPSYVPAGYSVKVSGAGTHQEFFYIAESNPERARAIIRDARGAADGSVTIMGTILYQTVARLGLRPGEFVPAPRIAA